MTIVNKHHLSEPTNGNNSGSRIYCIELEPDVFVDVKFIKETGLIYVMQNHDGSVAYKSSSLDDHTLPGYQFDEKEVIALVTDDLKKEVANG